MEPNHGEQLESMGFVRLVGLLSPDEVERIRADLEVLWADEGAEAGRENYIEAGIRRLANLANKGGGFREFYANPEVLELIASIIGREVRASMVNARDVPPHTGVRMPFHTDTDGDRTPDDPGYIAATAIWMLDPFTVESGATALVPGSHRSGKRPKEVMDDPSSDHPEEVILTGDAGDVLVFNGHCWHAGRPNQTDGHRRALLVHYLRADVDRPANRRQHLDPERVAALTHAEAELLGIDD